MSIRVKALVLFVLFAVGPVVAMYWVLLPRYAEAIRTSEERNNQTVLAAIRQQLDYSFRNTERDTETMAQAFARAAKLEGEEAPLAEPLIRTALASCANLAAVRFEVPSADVDTVIAKEGAGTASLPKSTAESRERAIERGSAFELLEPDLGVIVVAVPSASPSEGVRGFVSAPVHLKQFRDELGEIITARGLGSETRLLLTDEHRRAIASHNVGGVVVGEDVSGLPVFAHMPAVGTQASELVSTAHEFDEGGRAMFSGVDVVPGLGWNLAIWRPLDVALADYARVEALAKWYGAGALSIAIVVGLWAAAAVTRPVMRLRRQAALIGQRNWSALETASRSRDELGDLSRAVRTMATDLQTSEAEIAKETALRGDLSRFLSQEVVDGIVRGDHPLALGGRTAEITVLFVDMVAFTKAAETKPPEVVVAMLNELFTMLSEVVFRHHGMVDKFIGDCLMAVWGAPLATEDHAERALAASEDMMRFLDTGAKGWRERYDIDVRVAIGINSGAAIVGNVGSEKRMEYTVVGDVVNVAARLEAIAAPNQVLVGERTARLVGDGFPLRRLGERALTGRDEPVEIFELEVES